MANIHNTVLRKQPHGGSHHVNHMVNHTGNYTVNHTMDHTMNHTVNHTVHQTVNHNCGTMEVQRGAHGPASGMTSNL